ncbi:MAG TPA: hypothetical protein VGZ22_02840 [Isosphaeraceae bacterium]|nr:hypothetical protein [Isosphaeraceae bacterium]
MSNESSFKSEADAALASFQATRNNLEKQVRRGEITPKVAREQASAAVTLLRSTLEKKSEGYSPVARTFLDRLIEASNARRKTGENLPIEGLQRETNQLLRQSLIEQQVLSRAVEFEGKTFLRPISGGPASPTLDGLLNFHESATLAGDEPAREWTRRQLEGFRSRVVNPDDHRRIDLACDRPDQVNPRLVAGYIDSMQGRALDELETFVSQAVESRDANACTAAYMMAREAPEGTSLRWVRSVLNGLRSFPGIALVTLRACEADSRRAEADAAKAHADYAIALAESDARFSGLETPADQDLQKQARIEAKPVAQWDQPIGLAVDRRGLTDEEFGSMTSPPTDLI